MFNILFEKKSSREERNNRYLAEINEVEKCCTPLTLGCYAINGWWGIWLSVDDETLLVNPTELISSILKDDQYYFFEEPKDECNLKKYPGLFYVDVRREEHVFSWTFENVVLFKTGNRTFTFEEYLSKITSAVACLEQVWKEGKQIAYKPFDVSLEAVEICNLQLQIKCTLPSHFTLRAKNVIVESFHFLPIEDEFFEHYSVGIGKRGYKTWLSHWDSNFEQIRHQLECVAFESEASVHLSFDMSDTIITFRYVSVLNEVNQVDTGITYNYKYYMTVEIEPNEFVHMPVLKGYCENKEPIKTFYEGLLKYALSHPVKEDKYGDEDVPPRMIAYNKFKSPIIENYLKGVITKNNEYAIRQVIVKHVLRIEPDYDVLFFDEEDVAWEDLDDLYDKQGKPIEMPELIEWQREIHHIVIASETGEPYEKDWAEYHRRGLELAHQLRERLSTEFDLWYSAPFEDKSGIIPERILIF